MPITNTEAEIAARLLGIGAIRLNLEQPYTWASGWKSPIYCDNRLTLSFPELRLFIKEKLATAINKNYGTAECIAGVATAGIPQGVLVAEKLGLPFVYVRSKPKGHGLTNMIEGKITPGQKVVILEDLVSTGGSSLKAAEDLKQAGFHVLGMAAIFTYGFDTAVENFRKAAVKLVCLSHYQALIEKALETGYVKESQFKTLKNWREDPAGWGH